MKQRLKSAGLGWKESDANETLGRIIIVTYVNNYDSYPLAYR